MGDLDEQTAHGFSTRAIHAGQQPDPSTGAVVPAVSLSTTFAQDGVGGHKGFEYSRSGNPTRSALEVAGRLARAGAPRPGLRQRPRRRGQHPAAAPPGQRVLLGNDAYGGTFRLISKVWGPLGYPVVGGRPDRSRCPRGGLARRRRDGVAGNADQPAAHVLRHRGDRRPRPTTTERSSWSTTRSPRRTCSSR